MGFGLLLYANAADGTRVDNDSSQYWITEGRGQIRVEAVDCAFVWSNQKV